MNTGGLRAVALKLESGGPPSGVLLIHRGLFTAMLTEHLWQRLRWPELDQLRVDDLVNNPHRTQGGSFGGHEDQKVG
jgi:hypothetical protein